MNPHSATESLRETHFHNEPLNRLGIEILSLDKLRRRAGASSFPKPERVEFFLLIYVTSGRGEHTVDFRRWPLTAGSLVVVRPGQVQHWQADPAYSARIVLIDPKALPYWGELSSVREAEHLSMLEWNTCARLTPEIASHVDESLRRLSSDLVRFDDSDLDVSLIRHELFVLLLRIARWQNSQANDEGFRDHHLATYRLFINALEAEFRNHHSLKFYASRIGYSESTIGRACRAMEGRSAKRVIDRRVALEGQRMLSHSKLTIAEIGHSLGFSEITNFVKFFRRLVGVTPRRFRIGGLTGD